MWHCRTRWQPVQPSARVAQQQPIRQHGCKLHPQQERQQQRRQQICRAEQDWAEEPASLVAEAEGDAAPSQYLLAQQAVQPSGMNQTATTLQSVRSLQSIASGDGRLPDVEAETPSGWAIVQVRAGWFLLQLWTDAEALL